jgi:histidine ammonia-lyase
MDSVILDGQPLTLAEIEAVSLDGCPVAIAPAALAPVAASRELIEEILAEGRQCVYSSLRRIRYRNRPL